jgi:hypothetical protein
MFVVVFRLVRYPPRGGCLVDPRSYSVRRELPLRALSRGMQKSHLGALKIPHPP